MASLYISIAENFTINALSSCCQKRNDVSYSLRSLSSWYKEYSWKHQIKQTQEKVNKIYPMYVVKYICYCILSYTIHGVCFAAARLPICKYTCWKIKKRVTYFISFEIRIKESENSYTTDIHVQLMPSITDRAISLAPSSYTSLVEQSPLYTLSIAKQKYKLWDEKIHNY